jgi:hypothetical protein
VITELINVRSKVIMMSQRTGARPSFANFPKRPLVSHRLLKTLLAFDCIQHTKKMTLCQSKLSSEENKTHNAKNSITKSQQTQELHTKRQPAEQTHSNIDL